jgi:hypothetical protein
MVFLSIAGFDRIAAANGSVSLNVGTKGDIAVTGFQPVVNDDPDKSIGVDKSAIRVTWIAIGNGERPQRRENRRQEKPKKE